MSYLPPAVAGLAAPGGFAPRPTAYVAAPGSFAAPAGVAMPGSFGAPAGIATPGSVASAAVSTPRGAVASSAPLRYTPATRPLVGSLGSSISTGAAQSTGSLSAPLGMQSGSRSVPFGGYPSLAGSFGAPVANNGALPSARGMAPLSPRSSGAPTLQAMQTPMSALQSMSARMVARPGQQPTFNSSSALRLPGTASPGMPMSPVWAPNGGTSLLAPTASAPLLTTMSTAAPVLTRPGVQPTSTRSLHAVNTRVYSGAMTPPATDGFPGMLGTDRGSSASDNPSPVREGFDAFGQVDVYGADVGGGTGEAAASPGSCRHRDIGEGSATLGSGGRLPASMLRIDQPVTETIVPRIVSATAAKEVVPPIAMSLAVPAEDSVALVSGEKPDPAAQAQPSARLARTDAKTAYQKHVERTQKARGQRHKDTHGMRISKNRWENWDEPWLDTSHSHRSTCAVFSSAGKGSAYGELQRSKLPLEKIAPDLSLTVPNTARGESADRPKSPRPANTPRNVSAAKLATPRQAASPGRPRSPRSKNSNVNSSSIIARSPHSLGVQNLGASPLSPRSEGKTTKNLRLPGAVLSSLSRSRSLPAGHQDQSDSRCALLDAPAQSSSGLLPEASTDETALALPQAPTQAPSDAPIHERAKAAAYTAAQLQVLACVARAEAVELQMLAQSNSDGARQAVARGAASLMEAAKKLATKEVAQLQLELSVRGEPVFQPPWPEQLQNGLRAALDGEPTMQPPAPQLPSYPVVQVETITPSPPYVERIEPATTSVASSTSYGEPSMQSMASLAASTS